MQRRQCARQRVAVLLMALNLCAATLCACRPPTLQEQVLGRWKLQAGGDVWVEFLENGQVKYDGASVTAPSGRVVSARASYECHGTDRITIGPTTYDDGESAIHSGGTFLASRSGDVLVLRGMEKNGRLGQEEAYQRVDPRTLPPTPPNTAGGHPVFNATPLPMPN
jgi:hypothetical protein